MTCIFGSVDVECLTEINYRQLRTLLHKGYITPAINPGRKPFYFSFDQILFLRAIFLLKEGTQWQKMEDYMPFIYEAITEGKLKDSERIIIVGNTPLIISESVSVEQLLNEANDYIMTLAILPTLGEIKADVIESAREYNIPIDEKYLNCEPIGA